MIYIHQAAGTTRLSDETGITGTLIEEKSFKVDDLNRKVEAAHKLVESSINKIFFVFLSVFPIGALASFAGNEWNLLHPLWCILISVGLILELFHLSANSFDKNEAKLKKVRSLLKEAETDLKLEWDNLDAKRLNQYKK